MKKTGTQRPQLDQLPKAVDWSQAGAFALSLDHRMLSQEAEVKKEVEETTPAHSSLENNNNNKITSSSFCALDCDF